MNEVHTCSHIDRDGFAVVVWYWPDYWAGADAPSSCCRWFYFFTH